MSDYPPTHSDHEAANAIAEIASRRVKNKHPDLWVSFSLRYGIANEVLEWLQANGRLKEE